MLPRYAEEQGAIALVRPPSAAAAGACSARHCRAGPPDSRLTPPAALPSPPQVCGHRGHGMLHRAVLGSVSTHLTHHSKVPVVVIRSEEKKAAK